MLKLRTATLALVMMLTMIFASATSAQDTCFGLAEADCQAIGSATENTLATVTSFYQNWSIDFSVTGVPGAELMFKANGEGPVVFDFAGAFPISFDQKVAVTFNDGSGEQSGETGAIIVDGVLYLDMGGQWMGVSLLEALANPEALGLPVDPAALLGGDADPAAAGQLESAMAVAEQFGALAAVPGFLTYVREGDTFTFTADVATLAKDPAFSEVLTGLAANENQDIAQVAGIGMMLPMLLENGKVTVSQTIDAAANVVTNLKFTTDVSINAAMLSSDMTDPIVVALVFDVTLSQANAAFELVAPEGAIMQELPAGN